MTGIEIKVPIDLVTLAYKQGWIDKLINVFKTKHRVLVLGASGVGKTNFINSLTELLPDAIAYSDRTRFPKDHTINIGDRPFVLIDTPGQPESKSLVIQEIQEAMRGISGIINVVSYGYHEGAVGKSEAIDPQGRIKTAYHSQGLQLEIDNLDLWIQHLSVGGVANWLITVVTKADLWWESKDEVIEYYISGAYHRRLAPAQSLSPVVMPYCSVFHRFFGEGSLSGTFDDSNRAELRTGLLREIISAAVR